jgi:hypothetical protein
VRAPASFNWDGDPDAHNYVSLMSKCQPLPTICTLAEGSREDTRERVPGTLVDRANELGSEVDPIMREEPKRRRAARGVCEMLFASELIELHASNRWPRRAGTLANSFGSPLRCTIRVAI